MILYLDFFHTLRISENLFLDVLANGTKILVVFEFNYWLNREAIYFTSITLKTVFYLYHKISSVECFALVLCVFCCFDASILFESGKAIHLLLQ